MRKTAALVLASALTASAAITASAAYADGIGGAEAPYARATAIVNADGTVIRSKGVTAVSKISLGQYCIQVDPGIDTTKSTPIANVRWLTVPTWNSSAAVHQTTNANCNTNRHFVVFTSNGTAAADLSFTVIVP